MSRKTWKKHCFLTLFAERRKKKWKNTVFQHFMRICTKCLKKREKNTVFSHFLHNVAQKTLIFLIFCELCTKCLEKRERTLFSHTLRITSRVVYKKRATSAFFHIFHIFPHFPHFSTFFSSLPLHFPNSCCKLHYSKEKMRLPKTLLMDTLILNLKPFLSESSNKVVPQNIFLKLLYFPALRHESFS